jgi:hypothetical protein
LDRGAFYFEMSKKYDLERMERKGNPSLIDTPENFSNWQVRKFSENSNIHYSGFKE